MALADVPEDDHSIAPPDGGGTGQPLPARLQPLARFIDEHFRVRPDDPAASRLDAFDFTLAFRTWLRLNHLPDAPGQAVTYSDLRVHFGLTVRRSSGNRYIIEGLQPTAHSEFDRLIALAHQPDAPLPQPELAIVSSDVRLQVRQQAQSEIEDLLGETYKEARDLLKSPDQNVRVRIIDMVWARTIPKVAVREVAPDAIDVNPVEARASLSDVMALIEAEKRENGNGRGGNTEGAARSAETNGNEAL
jgi:hypothetical protein